MIQEIKYNGGMICKLKMKVILLKPGKTDIDRTLCIR